MDLYIVRHGQSESNAAHIMQGSKIDKPLTEKGIQQARVTKEKLTGIQFDRVYSSPLIRAAQTAEIITGPNVTTIFDPRLKEFDYGKWDGQKIEKLVDKYPEYFRNGANFKNAWQTSGGESYDQAFDRLTSFTDDLPHNVNNILIVSHGMTIKLWIALILGIRFPERIAEPRNSGITHLQIINKMLLLRGYGE